MLGMKGVVMTVMVMVMLVVVENINVGNAATILVGGRKNGWDFDVFRWSGNGKTFKTGDTLVFQYDKDLHNLVIVDYKSYNTCTVPPGARVYNSGYDKIQLGRGPNYYICGILGQCDAGLQISVIGG